jgi:hypothetical protein
MVAIEIFQYAVQARATIVGLSYRDFSVVTRRAEFQAIV